MKYIFLILLLSILVIFAKSSSAEVLKATPSHFSLSISENSTLTPEQVWKKLIEPKTWWHSDHTYSGKAENLTLELKAGGNWREDWAGGSVLHGTIINIQTNKMLRLEAPFGPLQEKAIKAIWTISLMKINTGTTIKFEFVANGDANSELDKLAEAVNYVKSAAIRSLAKDL